MSIFTLARRMGTSVQMIDSTYGHLAQDGEDQDRTLLDAYDASDACGHVVGTTSELHDETAGNEARKTLQCRAFQPMGAAGFEPATSRV
jgi:hypothetical protein